jgi:hypothetical protein
MPVERVRGELIEPALLSVLKLSVPGLEEAAEKADKLV